MNVVWTTPTLSAKTSTGRAKFWRGVVLSDGAHHYRSSWAWQTTQSGAQSEPLVSEPALVTPKNVGQSNETSPLQQAIAEVSAKMAQKVDKGYAEEGQEHLAGNGYVLPMLAHKWPEKKHKATFPVLAQPKFDGTRMLYNSDVGHWSRQGKPYLPEVVAHINFDTQGLTLDGELMLLAGTFQDTVRAIKKYRPGVSEKLVYRVYDIVDEALPTARRQLVLQNLVVELRAQYPNLPVVGTTTYKVHDEDRLLRLHQDFLTMGFEGTMIRTLDSLYTPGQRNAGLLKLKDFDDAEFEITGFTDGLGKDAMTVIFTCKAGNGSFQVRPLGTVEERRDMFENGASYIGKMLTVRYQGLSEDGIPRFPVGVGVREVG